MLPLGCWCWCLHRWGGTGRSQAGGRSASDRRVPPPWSDIGGDLEAELLRLLGRGDKMEAIKLYKDQKGVALLEAKQAIETLSARHGLMPQRAGCLGMMLAVVVAAVALGMMIC